MALGSLVFGFAAGAARAFLGVGTGTKGWAPVGTHINDCEIPSTHPEWKDTWKGSRVENHRRFGRTGWNVSDIVLGTTRIGGEEGEQIARLAIERGVNYFDTSPDYFGAGSEMAMGKAIRSVPRDRLFIASKFCTPIGHLPPGHRCRSTSRRSRGASRSSAPTTPTSVTSTPATRLRACWTRTCTRRSTG